MKQRLIIGWFFLICWGVSPSVEARDDIELLTADLSPYSIEVGLRPGFFVEIVSLIEERLGTSRRIEYYPWPRAQMMARTLEKKIIFPLTRTTGREDKYNWLLDIAPIEYVFVTLDGRALSVEDAKKLENITVRQSTPFEAYLKAQGFRNIIVSPQASEVHLRLLKAGRVQAWFTARDVAEFTLLEETDLEATFSPTIHLSRVYLATSKTFPKQVADDYLRVFNELRKDGTLAHILKQYHR